MSESAPAAPDFDELAALFWRLGAMQSPTELHGYLTGQLTVGASPEPALWLQQAESYINTAEPLAEGDSSLLIALLESTRGALAGDDMTFAPLLPEEETDLGQRVDSLGQWCQGFLTGFAEAGKKLQQQQGQRQWSKQVSEALSDLAAMTQAALVEEEGEDEAGEQNFMELVEYIRVAVMAIHLESHALPTDPAAADSALPGEDDVLH